MSRSRCVRVSRTPQGGGAYRLRGDDPIKLLIIPDGTVNGQFVGVGDGQRRLHENNIPWI